MSSLAPRLQAFFTDRLLQQRQASAHTVAAYRDTFRLLLAFVQERLGKSPTVVELQDLDAPLIGEFLDHLQRGRGNSARTRNARLAALHSFFRYAALHEPACAAVIQRVLAIPHKRFDRALVTYLTQPEIEALLAAPDRDSWTGRRDHALLLLAVQTGLRVSELIRLSRQDVHCGTGAHVRCLGKGRKERCTPLTTHTVAALAPWLKERGGHLTLHCSPLGAAAGSAAMPSSNSSVSTPRPGSEAAHLCEASKSRLMCFATRAQCSCSTLASTGP